MGAETNIGWTDHTFNFVWGCHEVVGDPACENCYAREYAKMRGFKIWGQDAPRRELSDKYWKEPLKWNEQARGLGKRSLVFTSSMADVFEDGRPDLDPHRERLFDLIRATPHLRWQVLTKRANLAEHYFKTHLMPANVWLGVTAVTQKWVDARVPFMLRCGAPISFISVEPIMESINLDLKGKHAGVQWVIVGGESGPKRRPMELTWLADIVRIQCRDAGVACFVKQDSHMHPGRQGRIPDDVWAVKEFPA